MGGGRIYIIENDLSLKTGIWKEPLPGLSWIPKTNMTRVLDKRQMKH